MSSETIKIEVWEKGKEKAAWIEFAEDKKRDTYKVMHLNQRKIF